MKLPMDVVQFDFDVEKREPIQDITTQKPQKVRVVLSQLNDYLNDLLGAPQPRPEWMTPNNIEKVGLPQDEKKAEVDSLINQFKSSES